MSEVDQLLQQARDMDGSDLHLAAGSAPLVRRLGNLQLMQHPPLTAERVAGMLEQVFNESQRERFAAGHDLDLSIDRSGVGRFRLNAFRSLHGPQAAFRAIPADVPSLETLGLPAIVSERLRQAQHGLILVTGATGAGKTTTLAAMIKLLNDFRRLNIITLEDPVEYVHKSNLSLVIQREIGVHVRDFSDGLRAALREDPDVILVGELRDPATIAMAMTAAETGHLVLGTLHTASAAKTLDRIIDATPTEQKSQAAMFLAQHLNMVISQVLVRSADHKRRRVVAEIMVRTPAIANSIVSRKLHQIPSLILTGAEHGMRLLDQALLDGLRNQAIDADDAYLHAQDRRPFQRFVNNPDLLPRIDLPVA